MGNEQSAEGEEVGPAPELPVGAKTGRIGPSSAAEQTAGNGDSTTASSPRRSSIGLAASNASSPSAKAKAKAKPKSKPTAESAQSEALLASAGKSKSGELSNDAAQPSPPAQEEGMGRYMTLSGLQELFSLHTYGSGAQQKSQEEGSSSSATAEASGQGSGGAGHKSQEAGASAATADGVSRYLPASLEKSAEELSKKRPAKADAQLK